jgi:hypothetical protein
MGQLLDPTEWNQGVAGKRAASISNYLKHQLCQIKVKEKPINLTVFSTLLKFTLMRLVYFQFAGLPI